MTPGGSWHLPLLIPIWGVIEASHIHINVHMNVLFHAMDGHIIGEEEEEEGGGGDERLCVGFWD